MQARRQNSPWSSTKGYKCGYHEHNINVVFMIGQYLIASMRKLVRMAITFAMFMVKSLQIPS